MTLCVIYAYNYKIKLCFIVDTNVYSMTVTINKCFRYFISVNFTAMCELKEVQMFVNENNVHFVLDLFVNLNINCISLLEICVYKVFNYMFSFT